MAFLFGGDKLARDVFSRMVHGSRIVLTIAPAATLIALMVGITLGLPAGYFGGRIDAVLSFLANLVLAFPVILLFYLLVTPGIMDTPIPYTHGRRSSSSSRSSSSACCSTPRYQATGRSGSTLCLGLTIVIGGWLYSGLVFNADPLGIVTIEPERAQHLRRRRLRLEPRRVPHRARPDAWTSRRATISPPRRPAAKAPWYIMLWEILPNARGPLIVDTCLRIGYTTILLGTLGFFGLGMAPESPDWGTAIKDGSQFLRLYRPAAAAAGMALMSFVLGLNLLADALREQSLRD